ncbi:MAG: hypothetical protein R3E02_16405 [Blastomonas sp.]
MSIDKPDETASETNNEQDMPADSTAIPQDATRVAITEVATRSAALVARRAISDTLLRQFVSSEARRQAKKMSLGGSLVGIVASRIATRSVPGALLVGTILAGKAYGDYRRAKKARKAEETGPITDEVADGKPEKN